MCSNELGKARRRFCNGPDKRRKLIITRLTQSPEKQNGTKKKPAKKNDFSRENRERTRRAVVDYGACESDARAGSSRGHPPWLRLFNPAHGFLRFEDKRTKPNRDPPWNHPPTAGRAHFDWRSGSNIAQKTGRERRRRPDAANAARRPRTPRSAANAANAKRSKKLYGSIETHQYTSLRQQGNPGGSGGD